MNIREQAFIKGIPHYLISDAGHTEVESGTKTCVAIGPYPSMFIDEITGNLKTYK